MWPISITPTSGLILNMDNKTTTPENKNARALLLSLSLRSKKT